MSGVSDQAGCGRTFGLFGAPDRTYREFVENIWSRICAGMRMPCSEADAAWRELTGMLGTWADDPMGTQCAVPSYVSADGFPAEFSLSWKRERGEARILFESPAGSAKESQEAGRNLTRRLADERGVSIERFLKVEDLFLAESPVPYRPTVWHSLAWERGTGPQYKVYLNPQAQGAEHAFEIVSEAMGRLELETGWKRVAARAAELRAAGHELEFFALDLGSDRAARAKVYFRHGPMCLSDMAGVAAMARSHDADRAAAVCRTIYGPDTTEVHNEPMTCLTFRQDSDEPEEANLYLRLPDNAPDDEEASRRIATAMRAEGLDADIYLDTVRDLCPRPLKATSGLQELLSYRTLAPGVPADIGVYLRLSTYDAPPGGRPG